MGYLWIKTFHIVFVTSWFAGLFYLPRIFVNLAMIAPHSSAERERLILMARRLYRFMLPIALIATALGLWLWLGYGVGLGPGSGWMHVKITLVVVIGGYHHACGRILRKFETNENRRGDHFYRWFNEAPVLLLIAVVALVVIKPF